MPANSAARMVGDHSRRGLLLAAHSSLDDGLSFLSHGPVRLELCGPVLRSSSGRRPMNLRGREASARSARRQLSRPPMRLSDYRGSFL